MSVKIPAQGTGDTEPLVATEDVGGVQFQQVKLVDPTSGSVAPIGVAANPIRVDPTGTTTQPVSAVALPLPSGAATDATLGAAATAIIAAINTPSGTQPISAAALPLPSGAATEATLAGVETKVGALIEAAPATDTASSGLNGRLQRIAQHLSTIISGIASIITGIGNPFQAGGTAAATQSGTWTVQPGNTANTTAWKTDGSGVTQPVSAVALPLPSGAATAAEQATQTASLSVMDDWDESDRAKVNVIAGQVGVAAGAGAVAANVPRTTLASDDPAVAVLGATADAAVSTDAVGSISAKLRGIVKIFTTLTQSVYQKFGTSVVFTNTGGNVAMTMKNIATGAGRISDGKDWGASPQPGWYKWEAKMTPTSSPTLGVAWRIYAYMSYVANSEVDTASDTALTAETQLNNFTLLGSVYASVSGAGPFYASGVVYLPGRYMNLGWWNASGVNTINTDGTTKITMTPLYNNQQPWAA